MRPPTPQHASAIGTQARREQGRPSGRDRYLSVLERARVPIGQRRWYVQRAEAFVGAMRPKRLSEVSAAEIKAFLPRCARERRLSDWQFRQTVDALQLLLVDLAQCPGAREVEWDFLRESGASLGANHPTVAAASTPEQVIDANPVYAKSTNQQPLLSQLTRTLRARRYALRTEQTYVDWCHRFLLFVAAQPDASAESVANVGKPDVERFLAHLAVDRDVAASTQNYALNALVFLFRHVLDRPLDEMAFSRARRPPRVPVVLGRDEVRALLAELKGTPALLAQLLYGTGMRLMEAVRLRVGDLDFANGRIVVLDAESGKDRVVPLPQRLVEPLRQRLEQLAASHREDLAARSFPRGVARGDFASNT